MLKRELTVDLPKELERARAHGDLSENAEWAMAKQRQEFLRARLNNLEARVAELSMINLDSIPRDTVGLGSKVELEDLDEGGSHEYEIVVPEEVDGAQNQHFALIAAGRADRQGVRRRYRSANPERQARLRDQESDHHSHPPGAGERSLEGVGAGATFPESQAGGHHVVMSARVHFSFHFG